MRRGGGETFLDDSLLFLSALPPTASRKHGCAPNLWPSGLACASTVIVSRYDLYMGVKLIYCFAQCWSYRELSLASAFDLSPDPPSVAHRSLDQLAAIRSLPCTSR